MALVDSILIKKLCGGSREAFLLLYEKYARARPMSAATALFISRIFLKQVVYYLSGGHP